MLSIHDALRGLHRVGRRALEGSHHLVRQALVALDFRVDHNARVAIGIEAVKLADALRDRGEAAAAAASYRKGVELLPERHDLMVQLGNMLKDSGQYEEAAAVYRTAIAAALDDSDIYLQLGRALKLAGRTDEAISAWSRALDLSPGFSAALDELDRLLPFEEVAALGPGARGVRSSVSHRGAGHLVGWAIDPQRRSEPVTLHVEIDGDLYQTLRATRDRSDLRRMAPGVVGGGFELRLPPGRGEVTVSVLHKGRPLRGTPMRVALAPPRRSMDAALVATGSARLSLRLRPVKIVVPVYNAARSVTACLDSLMRHTTGAVSLIVIDDASPDPTIGSLLDSIAGRAQIHVERNAENLGYTRTVNKGLALAGDADVILLNSDTKVGPRWVEGLRAAAYSKFDVASVTAISDNAGAFTVPEMNDPEEIPGGLSAEDYQRAVTQAAGTYWPELPTGNGFCLYLRRDALDEVGDFDASAFPRGYGEENDWSMRALRAGWRHLVDDRTLVLHERSASFGAEKADLMAAGRRVVDERYPEYRALIASFHTNPGLGAARHRIRRLHKELRRTGGISSGCAVPHHVRPRVLFVISTETGGTPLTNRDLMRTLSDRVEPWLLTSDSRTMTIARAGAGDGGMDVIVASEALADPVTYIEHTSKAYDETIAQWLIQYAIEIVHVRHLAWHSLGLTTVARRLGIPVVFSFHDFYTVCPTVKLLDERLVYCGGRCTATGGDCAPDLWQVDARPPLKHLWITEWRRRQWQALEACDAFVTTSESAKRTLVDAFPPLLERRFDVIPHGRDFDEMTSSAVPSEPLQQLDILVPGNLSPAKGRDLLEALSAMDQANRLRFHILGEVHPALEGPSIVMHGAYKRDEFSELARRTGAQVGAVFSIWSETYCHTLTEMWAIGLPVVGFDLGAVAERIEKSGAGWIAPRNDIRALYDFLAGIADNPADIALKSAAVAQWQSEEGRRNTCRAMGNRYMQLYEEVLERRRSFSGAATRYPSRIGSVEVVHHD